MTGNRGSKIKIYLRKQSLRNNFKKLRKSSPNFFHSYILICMILEILSLIVLAKRTGKVKGEKGRMGMHEKSNLHFE